LRNFIAGIWFMGQDSTVVEPKQWIRTEGLRGPQWLGKSCCLLPWLNRARFISWWRHSEFFYLCDATSLSLVFICFLINLQIRVWKVLTGECIEMEQVIECAVIDFQTSFARVRIVSVSALIVLFFAGTHWSCARMLFRKKRKIGRIRRGRFFI